MSIKFHLHDHPNGSEQVINYGLAKMDEENWLEPYRGNNRQYRRMLGAAKIVSTKDEHINCLSNTKCSALKTFIQVILYGLSSLFKNIHM